MRRIDDWFGYFRYRARLVRFNRSLARRNVATDLTFVHGLSRLGLQGATLTLLAAFIGGGGLVALGVLVSRWGYVILTLWFTAEITWWVVRIGPIRTSHSLATPNRTMLEGSRDFRRASMVSDLVGRGRRNSAFLELLFASYEESRDALHAAGFEVTALRDSEGNQVGAWSLPLPDLLTDVVVVDGSAHIESQDAVKDRVERLLSRFASAGYAGSRTRLLAQIRQLRRSEISEDDAGGKREPLNESELDRACAIGEPGLNHVLRGLVTEESSTRLSVDRATYGQIMRSCDYMIEETLIAAGICAQGKKSLIPSLRWIFRTMPAREHVRRGGVQELLLEPRGRAPGIGLAAITATKTSESTVLYFKQRSYAVGTYPNLFHAVPTGMYNSKTGAHRTRLDQRVHPGRVLLTEFLEELFDARDLDDFEANEHWRPLVSAHLALLARTPDGYAGLRDLVSASGHARDSQMIARLNELQALAIAATAQAPADAPDPLNRLQIKVTGLAFDLLSLRPEICCVIEMPYEWAAHIRLNEEARDLIHTMPSDLAPTFDQLPPPTEWVPSGMAAMILANEFFNAETSRELNDTNSCRASDFDLRTI